MEKNLKIALLLDEYGALLPERQLNCLHCYYNEDLSLSEIAENESITRQGVHDNIKRGELFLLQCEEKLRFVKRLESIEKCLDRLSAALDDKNNEKAKAEIANIKELL